MAEREALWDWDLDDSPADLGDSTRNGHEPITEPIPVVEADYVEADYEAPGRGRRRPVRPSRGDREGIHYAGPFIDRRPGSPMSTLTFKPAPTAVVPHQAGIRRTDCRRSRRGGARDRSSRVAYPLPGFRGVDQRDTDECLTRIERRAADPRQCPAHSHGCACATTAATAATSTSAPPTQESAPASTRQYPAPRNTSPSRTGQAGNRSDPRPDQRRAGRTAAPTQHRESRRQSKKRRLLVIQASASACHRVTIGRCRAFQLRLMPVRPLRRSATTRWHAWHFCAGYMRSRKLLIAATFPTGAGRPRSCDGSCAGVF